MKNTATRYGVIAKSFHWAIFLLFVNQFVVAAAMLNTAQGETTAGFTQGQLYNWHKSIGLLALAVALGRYVWRNRGPLPDWAPNLSEAEMRWLPRIEHALYVCMFAMPVSGFVFVMAGGYGVNFFGVWAVPNVLGEHKTVAAIADWVHRVTAVLLVLALLAHWALGIRHHLTHRDRYLNRMLPFTHQK